MYHSYQVICSKLALRDRPSLAAEVVSTLHQNDKIECMIGETKLAYGYLWRQTLSGLWIQAAVINYKGDVIQELAAWVDAKV